MALSLPDVQKHSCVLPEAGRVGSISPWDTGVPGWGTEGNLGCHGVPIAFSLLWNCPLLGATGQWVSKGLGDVLGSWADEVGSLSLTAENIKCQTHQSQC